MLSTRAYSPPYRSHSSGPRSARDYSPPQLSPRNIHQWSPARLTLPPGPGVNLPLFSSYSTSPHPPPSRRCDPSNDGRGPRESRDYDPMVTRPHLRSRPPSHHGSPESVRNALRQAPPPPSYASRSPSPHLSSPPGMQLQHNRGPGRRGDSQKKKEPEPPYSPSTADAKRDRKRKNPAEAPTSSI
jgi:hypothetical protein